MHRRGYVVKPRHLDCFQFTNRQAVYQFAERKNSRIQVQLNHFGVGLHGMSYLLNNFFVTTSIPLVSRPIMGQSKHAFQSPPPSPTIHTDGISLYS